MYTLAAFVNVISLIIGITFGLFLIFTKRKNQSANRFLGFIPIIVALWQCWVLVITRGLFKSLDFLQWVPFSCLMAIGPCIYFYTKYTTSDTAKFKRRDFTHFIPLLIELVIFFGYSSDGDLENRETYTLFSTRFIMQLCSVISIVCYSYFSIKRIKAYNNENDLDHEDNLKWLNRLIVIFAVLWAIWIPYALINNFVFNYYISDYDFYPLHTLIWFFTLWMGATVFLKPEVVLIENSRKKVKILKIPSKQIIEHGQWLIERMKLNKYYLNPDLTMQSLASELGLHANVISKTINEGLNKSFSDFVNEYRINSVIEKLNNPEYSNITVLGMAYDSGFNSKTTFNRAFKKATGKTPMAYKEQFRKI